MDRDLDLENEIEVILEKEVEVFSVYIDAAKEVGGMNDQEVYAALEEADYDLDKFADEIG